MESTCRSVRQQDGRRVISAVLRRAGERAELAGHGIPELRRKNRSGLIVEALSAAAAGDQNLTVGKNRRVQLPPSNGHRRDVRPRRRRCVQVDDFCRGRRWIAGHRPAISSRRRRAPTFRNHGIRSSSRRRSVSFRCPTNRGSAWSRRHPSSSTGRSGTACDERIQRGPGLRAPQSRHRPVATSQTCGRLFRPTVVSMSPDRTSTSPFGSVVVVGYHRPAFMFGSRVPSCPRRRRRWRPSATRRCC